MHGIVHQQLNKFLKTLADTDTINSIYKEAGVFGKFYDATKHFADEELAAILTATCKKLNIGRDAALEEFGKFITPALLVTYKSFIKPEWKALDLLEHIENTIHKAVRASNPGALPPQLEIIRESANEVVINYTSPRKMQAFGIGIIKKIAEHYNEKIQIVQSAIPGGTRIQLKK
ncbi:MAG: hypothetical protein OJF59_001962 [Cytophagales bacterium]|jgi:hypothetical protein|nr:heme NO-binding domain-containing protein [Bacteroidota bacterium]MBS1980862.1 heme NO-binding domain-containing protein [Bacteroidota bacterium]WHZ08209.1 MAG: hypothetical protein OJF59_001962 [Cytophagales bacterium]